MYQSDRIADDLDGRGHRTKILLDDKSSRFDLRVHKHLMHLVDRSGRNALDLEGTQQLELRQGADLLAQDRNQRSAVPHAVGISFKSRIGRKFWEAERSRKTRELGIVAHRDNNVSIAGRECLVGHDIGMGIAVCAPAPCR